MSSLVDRCGEEMCEIHGGANVDCSAARAAFSQEAGVSRQSLVNSYNSCGGSLADSDRLCCN